MSEFVAGVPPRPETMQRWLRVAAVVTLVGGVMASCAKTGNGDGCFGMGEVATVTPGLEGGPLLTGSVGEV